MGRLPTTGMYFVFAVTSPAEAIELPLRPKVKPIQDLNGADYSYSSPPGASFAVFPWPDPGARARVPRPPSTIPMRQLGINISAIPVIEHYTVVSSTLESQSAGFRRFLGFSHLLRAPHDLRKPHTIEKPQDFRCFQHQISLETTA